MPEWLKNELQDADAMDGAARPATRGGKKQEMKAHAGPISNKDKQEYKKKLEKDFHRKQIEIRMEAQNAVREREKALNEEVVRLRQELNKHKQEKSDILTARVTESRVLDQNKGTDSTSSTCSVQ